MEIVLPVKAAFRSDAGLSDRYSRVRHSCQRVAGDIDHGSLQIFVSLPPVVLESIIRLA